MFTIIRKSELARMESALKGSEELRNGLWDTNRNLRAKNDELHKANRAKNQSAFRQILAADLVRGGMPAELALKEAAIIYPEGK